MRKKSQMETKLKIKYRASYWVDGQQKVKIMGSRGLLQRWLDENEPRAYSVSIEAFQLSKRT